MPPNSGNLLSAAVAHHKAGRLKKAAHLYRAVLKEVPGNPDALHFLGVLALDEGRIREAIDLISKTLVRLPRSAAVHSNLGNALRAGGRHADAIESYRRALLIDPNFAAAHNNLGRALNDVSDFTSALPHCRRAAELAADLAEAHANLANALLGVGRKWDAATAYQRAIDLKPNFAEAHNGLGVALLNLGQVEQAIACHRQAVQLRPAFAFGHYCLGNALWAATRVEEAAASYRQAVTIEPGHAAAWMQLGFMLCFLGKFEEATQCFQRTLELKPDSADASAALAISRGEKRDPEEISRIAALAVSLAISRGEKRDLEEIKRIAALAASADVTLIRSVPGRIGAMFTLAKLLDDGERYDEAFLRYAEANALQRALLADTGQRFDPDGLRSHVGSIIETWSAKRIHSSADWGNPSELPVFIVGMPRSGTTLVEQIAASHTRVFGAGELKDIERIAAELALHQGGFAPWLQAGRVRSLADEQLDRLRILGGGAERVIDKMPDNIFHLGTIATLYPKGRIIFCSRDPRDVCLSCYFQKFMEGHEYSYDLADCARRYAETQRLVEHWRLMLPLAMLEVSYETLVENFEKEARRLIAFLGLDWEPACLDFHRTERSVTTASAWEVRQPLYQRSVGRWKHYERHLEPLLDVLREAHGI
jgi:tetratricopeptide (TPR) repeat protein